MTNRFPSLLAAVACFMPLSACASMEGTWPSLKTPAEQRTGTCGTSQVAMAGPAAVAGLAQQGAGRPQAATTASGVTVAAVSARLAEETRSFNAAQEAWTRQRATTESAVSAARSAAPASQAWATAELELTRFNQTAARFDQIREVVSGLTGDLALLAANGADVQAALQQAGRLLGRIDEAAAAHQTAATPLQADMPR